MKSNQIFFYFLVHYPFHRLPQTLTPCNYYQGPLHVFADWCGLLPHVAEEVVFTLVGTLLGKRGCSRVGRQLYGMAGPEGYLYSRCDRELRTSLGVVVPGI